MERKMINNLIAPLHISLTTKDELHITDPRDLVDGWNIIHLSTDKVLHQCTVHLHCSYTHILMLQILISYNYI